MQLLSLYTTILPALRHRQVRLTYAWWAWTSHWAVFLIAVAAIVCHIFFSAVSPLLAFLGNTLQAFLVLQLVWIVNDGVARRVKETKEV